jgi:phosphotransferase system enzyme I (PtsP)
MATSASRSTVHGRGNPRLDAVLEFLSFAAKPMPLVRLLDEAPRQIARIFGADVCSVYLLEGDGNQLVMRANVGLVHTGVGQVRLAVGEGLTGEAVEYLRPVSSDLAHKHATYKHFDELGEEDFPVFLATPIRGKAGALGALVVQRRHTAWDAHDVELLSTLGAVVGACVRHAELIDAERDRAPKRKAAGGTRKVTLPGAPVVRGRALGAIAALRRPAARQSERHIAVNKGPGDELRLLEGAFDVAQKSIVGLSKRAKDLRLGRDAAFLSTYVEILGDGRFRERAAELVLGGGGIPQALSRVAREVTRTAASITKDPFLEERAKDVEDLCDALTMLAAGDKRAELPSRAVLVGDALTVFDLLISARAHPVAVALTNRASGPRTRTLLQLLDVPAVVGVDGLFRWAGDGDTALVDADHGLLVLNPSKSEIVSLREHRKHTDGAR